MRVQRGILFLPKICFNCFEFRHVMEKKRDFIAPVDYGLLKMYLLLRLKSRKAKSINDRARIQSCSYRLDL